MTKKQISSFAFFAFLFLSIFAACNSSGSSTSHPNLPPDPGIAGEATLAGIDSDGDGVRDDIQRYIVLTYPDQPEVQKALRQYAKAKQDFILNAEDAAKTMENATKVSQSTNCLYSKDVKNPYDIGEKIDAKFANTKERILAEIKADSHLSGHVFSSPPMKDWPKSCTD